MQMEVLAGARGEGHLEEFCGLVARCSNAEHPTDSELEA